MVAERHGNVGRLNDRPESRVGWFKSQSRIDEIGASSELAPSRLRHAAADMGVQSVMALVCAGPNFEQLSRVETALALGGPWLSSATTWESLAGNDA